MSVQFVDHEIEWASGPYISLVHEQVFGVLEPVQDNNTPIWDLKVENIPCFT
jgi:hypothetical protein